MNRKGSQTRIRQRSTMLIWISSAMPVDVSYDPIKVGCGRSTSEVTAVIQRSVAEIMKLAICRVQKALPKDCLLILAAGNLVLFEVPEGRLEEVSALICKTMEKRPPGFSVKLSVEIRSGKTWANCDPNRIIIKERRRAPGPRLPRIKYRLVD